MRDFDLVYAKDMFGIVLGGTTVVDPNGSFLGCANSIPMKAIVIEIYLLLYLFF